MARVSLTKKQLKTVEGAELLALLMRLTQDGCIDATEVFQLRGWIDSHEGSSIEAVAYLREVLNIIQADTVADMQDRWDLILAIEKVVPPEERALVKMRRRGQPEPATERQTEFLRCLGVSHGSELSKWDACELIDQHKNREIAARSERPAPAGKKGKEEEMGCAGWIFLGVVAIACFAYCKSV